VSGRKEIRLFAAENKGAGMSNSPMFNPYL